MEVTDEARPGHLFVVARERFDAAAAGAVIGEVARLCAQHRLDRVLVDFRDVTDIVSIADRHALGQAIAAAKVPARIAILVAEPQRHTAALEDTAVNRGASVRTTSSEAEARRFLALG
ncbi:MAG TPA: hypothetical protein VFV90_07555 [Usitatibacter sp.]|nr:hypothetical protein [Usitatibacter sp.]